MRNKKYTHLFFDLDNTLWDFERNSCAAMEIAFSIHIGNNNHINYNDFFKTYAHYNGLLWNDYRNQLVSRKELFRLRFQKTFEKLSINNVDADEMNATYMEEMPKQLRLVDGTLQVLKYLKSKGYQLNIISNGFSEVQYKKLENTGLSGFFFKIFLSAEVKIPKPATKIFEYAVKSTNARKTGSLMIGDDWEVDICGALDFGIDAVFFNHRQKDCYVAGDYDKKVKNLYCIENLTQLLTFL